MQQGEELRHDTFHLVGHEHLVAIELNLVALQFEVRLDAWEIEDTREVERIVNVQMNPEQRFVLHRIEGAVERLVIFVFQTAGCFCPQRFHIVDDVVLVSINLLAVFPFCFLAEGDGHSHELAVFVQQLLNLVLFQELFAVIVDVEDDVAASVGFLHFLKGEFGTSVAAPFHGFGTFLIGACYNLHLLADHEGRIKAESEVSDDGIGAVLVFVQEVGNAREGNLVDVFVNLFGSHTDTAVADGERLVLLIE